MKLLLALIISVSSVYASVTTCYNYPSAQRPVSFSYETCLNKNFRDLAERLDYANYMRRCSNYSGRRVSYGFTACINNNFRELASEFDDLYLSSCYNSGTDELSYGFKSCVRRNIEILDRGIETK